MMQLEKPITVAILAQVSDKTLPGQVSDKTLPDQAPKSLRLQKQA